MENNQNNIDFTAQMEKGVFNINDIDKYTIMRLANIKQNFAFNLSSLSLADAQNQLLDIATSMQIIIEKYAPVNLKERIKVISNEINGNAYSFYDYKNAILIADNIDKIRFLYENLNFIYEGFLRKVLNVALPTQKIDKKKA